MKKENNPLYTYYQYAALGFQMVFVMGMGMWAGLHLDQYFKLRTPVFLSTCAILSTILCIYGTIRKLLQQHKQQQDNYPDLAK